MNGGQRNGTNAQIWGESKTTRIMMATVPHVTSGLGLTKFQADGFLLTRVYQGGLDSPVRIATHYGMDVQGLNPGGSEISCARLERHQGSPSLLYIVYREFPGGKVSVA